MRRTAARLFTVSPQLRYAAGRKDAPPLISIQTATFYRHHPDSHLPATDGVTPPNPPLYPDLNFTLPSFSSPNQNWAVLSSSSTARSTFLHILRGQHLALPPSARSYPYLHTNDILKKDPRLRNPARAIQYVGFDAERGGLGGASTKGAYLSARYESHREITDWSVLDYLNGNTELNASEDLAIHPPADLVERVMKDLNLVNLSDMPVSNLSNGQTRRARIAKALLQQPELLLLDGPFMGLDPHTLEGLSRLLKKLADAREPRLVLSLRPQDVIPDWITHFVLVGNEPKAAMIGPKKEVFEYLRDQYIEVSKIDFEYRTAYEQMNNDQWKLDNSGEQRIDIVKQSQEADELIAIREIARKLEAKGDLDFLADDPKSIGEIRNGAFYRARFVKGDNAKVARTRDGVLKMATEKIPIGDPVVQMQGVRIAYGDKAVLGDWNQDVPTADGKTEEKPGLWWEVRQGQRWGVFGPNGSGKTTLLSLITSDHPQTYSAPVLLFGRSRLPSPGQPGISVFDLQSRMGHSSPEVHTFFPRHLSVRRVLESAWADTPLTKPRLDFEKDQKVDACLRWFRAELNPDLGETLDQRAEIFRNPREAGPLMAKKRLADARGRFVEIVETALHAEEVSSTDPLDWADRLRFRDLSFSSQRVALFLRAIIHQPDLLILDEAFSGMDELARDKCLLFLNHGQRMTFRVATGERHLRPSGPVPARSDMDRLDRVKVPGLLDRQALICVSHARDEVPGCVREWICLPEPGSRNPPRLGRVDGPVNGAFRRWNEIWNVPVTMAGGGPPPFDNKGSPFVDGYHWGTVKQLFKLKDEEEK